MNKDRVDSFVQGNITVTFRLLNEENIKISYIFIEDGNTEIGYYKRKFNNFNEAHYQNFINKFLSDTGYRKKYLIYGSWDGVIIEENKSIHPICEMKIKHINNRKDLKFKDFADLKTYGRDMFSGMTIKELKELISREDLNIIKKEFEDEKLVLNTARWMARGLYIGNAVRKVKTDLEIGNNARKGKDEYED